MISSLWGREDKTLKDKRHKLAHSKQKDGGTSLYEENRDLGKGREEREQNGEKLELCVNSHLLKTLYEMFNIHKCMEI